MKAKTFLITILTVLSANPKINAQTVLKGDMNGDEQITIADVTSTVNVILGKAPQETINIGGAPYSVDNSLVAGTWYAPDGTHFRLGNDGTTDFEEGYTYKFRPYQGTLTFYNATGSPVKTLNILEVESTYLLSVNYVTGAYTYYTNSVSLVTNITISEASLSINSGTTAQLSATITPSDAYNSKVIWTSSNENVATVDANGLVTAIAGGSCTIKATSADGSGIVASCQVTVMQMVTSITLSEETLQMEVDDYKIITAIVLPTNATNTSVSWSSSDESVAEITSNGGVVAVGKGICTITCTAKDGSGVSASLIVKVLSIDDSEIFTVNGVQFTMIKVEGGTFQMGSTSGESNESPVHQVTLTNDYYIGETEVTQELWTAVMGSNPSSFKTSNQLPVERVSWSDCQTFITKLNALTGHTFRLPTEAEWEFAARGGNASGGYIYSGSNTIGDVAWYDQNSVDWNSFALKTHEVATKAPNELGIYDMSGNVWEMCQDWYGSYSSEAQTNPTGPTSGSDRVHRGGGLSATEYDCRVATRSGYGASGTSNNLGLRLAL